MPTFEFRVRMGTQPMLKSSPRVALTTMIISFTWSSPRVVHRSARQSRMTNSVGLSGSALEDSIV